MILPPDDVLGRSKADVVLWYKEIAGLSEDEAQFMAEVALDEVDLGGDID